MSLQEIIDKARFNSIQLFDCIHKSVDDKTAKEIMGAGISYFGKKAIRSGQNNRIQQKNLLLQQLQRLFKNQDVLKTSRLVKNILSYLDWTDYRCKFVCQEWNQILIQTINQHVTYQPYLTIGPEMYQNYTPPIVLSSWLPLYNVSNDIPVTLRIKRSFQYEVTFGPYIVVNDINGDYTRAFLSIALVHKFNEEKKIHKFKKNNIIQVLKSRCFEKYRIYIDDCRFVKCY